jgi:hypothetical protein
MVYYSRCCIAHTYGGVVLVVGAKFLAGTHLSGRQLVGARWGALYSQLTLPGTASVTGPHASKLNWCVDASGPLCTYVITSRLLDPPG